MIDQISKYFAVYYDATYFAPFQRILHLPPIRNYGTAFHLFNFSDTTFFWIIRLLMAFIAGYFIFRAILKFQEKKKIFAEIAIIAGAMSNLIDRCHYGGVIDFIYFIFPFFNYIAVANIADIAITAGCGYLLYELFLEDYETYFFKQ